eukprot:10290546-Karenia_brevis.AAC.1
MMTMMMMMMMMMMTLIMFFPADKAQTVHPCWSRLAVSWKIAIWNHAVSLSATGGTHQRMASH